MAVQNQIAARAGKAGTSLSAYLATDAVKNQINQVVGGKDGPRFISSLVSAAQTNPQLAECSKQSLLSAALLGHSLNLSPSPQLGQFYMVPYKRKAKYAKDGKTVLVPESTEAQFQLGYKGFIQLAVRSGYYRRLNALAIKEGELIRYDPLNEEIEVSMIEDDVEREQAPTCGYYAMFEYENGFRKTLYWSKQKMLAHANRYSAAFNAKDFARIEAGQVAEKDMWKYSSFWYKDFDGMAIKTMLRQIISKWGIMSIDMQKAMETDSAVIQADLTPEYVEQEREEPAVYTQVQAEPVEAAVEPQKEPEPEKKPAEEKPAENKTAPADAQQEGQQVSIDDEFFGGK